MSSTLAVRLAVAALSLTGASVATAQATAPAAPSFEIRVPGGQFIGTGAQRDQLKDAQTTAAQLSWLLRPHLALTGTFSWARSRDIAVADAPKLDVFTTDIGLEARTTELRSSERVALRGFAGFGGGARSYNYRKLDAAATHNLAGYAAIGGEARMGRVGLRLEARDYATGFKPLVGAGKSSTRNDVVIMAAITLNRRAAR